MYFPGGGEGIGWLPALDASILTASGKCMNLASPLQLPSPWVVRISAGGGKGSGGEGG